MREFYQMDATSKIVLASGLGAGGGLLGYWAYLKYVKKLAV